MDYVIVQATGTDADYTVTTDFDDALRTYQSWLTTYLAQTGDERARRYLDRLNGAGHDLRGQVIEYRSPRSDHSASTGRVFVLGVLAWPAAWRLPPRGVDRNWGTAVRELIRPEGSYELRTDGEVWRILWLDARSEAACTTSRPYRVAAEAAAEFAFLEAFLSQQQLPISPHGTATTSR